MLEYQSKRYMGNEFPFWIQHQVHSGERYTHPHSHNFIELVYVVRGEAEHIFEGESYTLRAGDIFIINPGEVHTYQLKKGRQMDIINCLFLHNLIRDSLLSELEITNSMDFLYVQPFLNNSERFHHRLNLSNGYAAKVSSLLDEMIQEMAFKYPGFQTLIRLRMVELLILLSRYYRGAMDLTFQDRQANSLLTRRISGYLERNYDQKIRMESIAESFNVSVRHLNRMFKASTGTSMIDLLHRIRIQRAERLLRSTDYTITTIATMVGYDDSSFFSRLFVRHVGMTPGKFREGIKGN